MNLFRSASRILIIAHRGSSAQAPENTLAAFRLAAEQGADAIELDAKLSSDHQVVVIHDNTVERTTGTGGRIRDLSLKQLKNLDAGSYFGAQFSGEAIPTLAEVFETVGLRVLVNVELTNYATPGDNLVSLVCALVKDFHLEERVLFSSFLPKNLVRARQILPEVPCAILALPGLKGWLARSIFMENISPQAVNPYFKDTTASYLRRQAKKGRKTNVWTVNNPTDLARLAKDGANGLITDNPLTALGVLKNLAN